MTLIEKASIISDDNVIAGTMNNLFSEVIAKLEIRNVDTQMVTDNIKDKVERVVIKLNSN